MRFHIGLALIFIISTKLAQAEQNPGVYVSLSPFYYKKVELNWYGLGELTTTDIISLYDQDPIVNTTSRALLQIRPLTSNGYYRTEIVGLDVPDTVSDSRCLGLWITLSRKGKLCAIECFKANPRWMSNMKSCLYNRSLAHTAMAATHDSAAVSKYQSNFIVERFTRAQDISIWQQLVYGVRFLDLRPGVSVLGNRFYMIHGSFFLPYTVEEILAEIKTFLDTTEEILIIEFAGFNIGFDGELGQLNHDRLIKLIHETFQDYMIPRSYGGTVTLGRLWDENKRLVVAYKNDIYKKYPKLWHHVISTYAGTMDVNKLKRIVFEDLKKYNQSEMRVAYGQLTPQEFDVLDGVFNKSLGLRFYANQLDRKVTSWFRRDLSKLINIIMCDYILGSDLVNVAIQENYQRCPITN